MIFGASGDVGEGRIRNDNAGSPHVNTNVIMEV